MTESISFEKVEYLCGIDGCGFHTTVADPNNLSLEDAWLLNTLINPEASFTDIETARLKELLGQQIGCPSHGRQKVGFIVTQGVKHIEEFDIVLDPEADCGEKSASPFIYESVKIFCDLEGCTYAVNIPNPNDLSEDDVMLLNCLVANTSTVFTPEQLARLKELLSDQIDCPLHGRDYTAFEIVEAAVIQVQVTVAN